MLHARDGSEGRRIVVRPAATMSTVEATTLTAQYDRIVDCGRDAATHVAVLLGWLHAAATLWELRKNKGGKTVSKARADDELTPPLLLDSTAADEH
jgi:hypothetical protein